MEIVTSWMEEGIKQGLQQGMQQTAREAVEEVLQARFGAVPASVTEKLQMIEEVTVLKKLLRVATTAAGMADFRRQL